MKYLMQFTRILVVSLVGELLHHFIPLPVPASVYGLVILFLLLETGVVKLHQVKETGDFLIEIMPVMFIPSAVGVMESWNVIAPNVISYCAVAIVSTVLVMGAGGLVTQFVIRKGARK